MENAIPRYGTTWDNLEIDCKGTNVSHSGERKHGPTRKLRDWVSLMTVIARGGIPLEFSARGLPTLENNVAELDEVKSGTYRTAPR